MSKTGKRVTAAVLALAAVVTLVIIVFDWNMLKGPIERRVAEQTGRELALRGDIDVDLGLRPLVRVRGIEFGNAAWGSEPLMFTADELRFRLDLPQLLRGRVLLHELALEHPWLLLEQSGDTRRNWEFGDDEPGGEPPAITHLEIRDGRVQYRNPAIDTDVTVTLTTAEAGPERGPGLRVLGEGRYRGEAFTLRGETGGVLALRERTQRYPIDLRAEAGPVRAAVRGHLPVPLGLDPLDVHLELAGPDLARLYPLIPVPLPETPPFSLRGHLLHSGETWRFEDFDGRVGDSDLAGDFRITSGERTAFQADLVSERLAFKDLAGFVHSKDKASAEADDSPRGRLLSERPYKLNRLRAADADVRFRASQVVATRLPLDEVQAHFKLKDGHLTIDPLDFGVAGGTVAAVLELDARSDPIRADTDLKIRQLHLQQLIPRLGDKLGEGLISGRGKLTGTGNSVAALLGSADGEIAAVMSGGEFSHLLLELADIDLAEALPAWLAGDNKVPIRCVAADFRAEDGVLHSQTLVMDTADTKIVGEGSIDLKQERLDLTLRAQPKDPSPLALRGPIYIRGPFSKPEVAADKGSIAARAATATALGVLLTPLAAFLPVVEWGLAEDANCGALLRPHVQAQ